MAAIVRVFGCRDRKTIYDYVNTTSHSQNWSRGLSPFFLGPVHLYSGFNARNVENGWQYAKVYKKFANSEGDPLPTYWDWAFDGWNNSRAIRYPMGKGASPLYSLWNGEKLSYIEARKRIYCPLYSKAVRDTQAFAKLRKLYKTQKELWLWDFDGYDHLSKGMTYKDVLNDPNKKMGHAFVLAMMLDKQEVWKGK